MTTTRESSARRFAGMVLALSLSAGAAGAGDGDPDPLFGGGDGMHVLQWGQHAEATAVEAIADGKLLVAGRIDPAPFAWGVARITAGGAYDAFSAQFSFFTEGASATYEVFDIAIDAQGRILLAGWVETGEEVPRPALARLTAAGQFDVTFDGDGLQIISTPPEGWILTTIADAQLLPDGRAVFFGNCSNCWGANPGAYLLRTTAAGAPDGTFVGSGWMSFGPPPELQSIVANAIHVQTSGVMTLAGSGSVDGGSRRFVARLHPGGAFDSAFHADGFSEIANLGSAGFTDLAIDPVSGRVVLATAFGGITLAGGGLFAYDANGAVIASFGEAGYLDLDIEEGSRMDTVAIQSDGRIVTAGTINANGTQPAGFLLARATAAGALDTTFDGNGLKRVEFDRTVEAQDRAWAATLSGGRLVVVGEAKGAALDDAFAILRTESALVFADGFERGSDDGWESE